LPARKMRVEVYDEVGNRYTISLEGRVTRENALRVLDIVELLGGMRGAAPDTQRTGDVSRFERLRLVVEKHFPLGWFSAKDAMSAYEEETGEDASPSTVSTYLARLSKRGALARRKKSNRVVYRSTSTRLKKMAETFGS
jgi:hypothetical protein